MKRIAVWLTVLFATMTTTSLGLASPSQAAENQCAAGQVCLWGENNFTGCFKGMTATGYDYTTISWSDCPFRIQDGANSIANYGNSCAVRMFEHVNHGGAWIQFNRIGVGGIYKDDALFNGGGQSGSTGSYWQDTISSHKFCP